MAIDFLIGRMSSRGVCKSSSECGNAITITAMSALQACPIIDPVGRAVASAQAE